MTVQGRSSSWGIQIGLQPDVQVECLSASGLVFRSKQLEMRLYDLPTALCDRLANLPFGSVAEEGLLAASEAAHVMEHQARIFSIIDDLARRGWIHWSLTFGNSALKLEPMSRHFESDYSYVTAAGRYLFSRFSFMRRENEWMIMENPIAKSRLIVTSHDVIPLIFRCLSPASLSDLLSVVPNVDPGIAVAAATLLLRAGLLVDLNKKNKLSNSVEDSLWEFHDAVFHTRSRAGRHHYSYGVNLRIESELPPSLPQLRPDDEVESIKLGVPAALPERSLFQAISERRSRREYAGNPITKSELSAFLWSVARVTGTRTLALRAASGLKQLNLAFRPFANAGGLYEVDFYVLVNKCEGVQWGLWYYDPENHRLIFRSRNSVRLNPIIAAASWTLGVAHDDLQIIIILAARFPRVSFKYSSMAYAAILKNVGVIFSTMYLAAEGLGLAACALGGGDSDAFATASDLDYFSTGSVGEFLIGSSAGDAPE